MNEVLLAPLIHPSITVVVCMTAKPAAADAFTITRAVQVQRPASHPLTDAAPWRSSATPDHPLRRRSWLRGCSEQHRAVLMSPCSDPGCANAGPAGGLRAGISSQRQSQLPVAQSARCQLRRRARLSNRRRTPRGSRRAMGDIPSRWTTGISAIAVREAVQGCQRVCRAASIGQPLGAWRSGPLPSGISKS